jgi:hypothetical protein
MPRHNKTYRGKLTRYQKNIRIKLALVLTILIMPILGMIFQPRSLETFDHSEVIQITPEEMKELEAIAFTHLSVEEQIREIAREHNFQWPDYLVKLAHCESTMNPSASNSIGNKPVGSIDRGLFQINDYWHPNVSDECAYNLRCSTEYTIKLINKGKQNLWVCNNKVKGVPLEVVLAK